MTELVLIDREDARKHPAAFASLEAQMREAADNYHGELTMVTFMVASDGTTKSLRALVADSEEFHAWLSAKGDTPQPFSLFVEASLVAH